MALVLIVAFAIGPRTAAAQGPHDFDFLSGTWSVHNRRLTKILAGSTEWYEFDAQSIDRPLDQVVGNVEEWTGVSPKNPINGILLSVYNPTSQEWSLLWVNKAAGTIDHPMIGKFHDRKGEFYDQETFEGQTILARNIWVNVSPTSVRWEQAFSADGGKTWETNWVMEYSRQKS